MSSAAQLGNLLNVTADLNYYTMQLNMWSAKYEANSEKLTKQQSYEEKYEDAYSDAINHGKGDGKLCKGGVVIKADQQNVSVALATKYAQAKAPKYDADLSAELADLDMEYDTMKTMYEALVTLKQSEKDSDKTSTQTALQDTHLLQS